MPASVGPAQESSTTPATPLGHGQWAGMAQLQGMGWHVPDSTQLLVTMPAVLGSSKVSGWSPPGTAAWAQGRCWKRMPKRPTMA